MFGTMIAFLSLYLVSGANTALRGTANNMAIECVNPYQSGCKSCLVPGSQKDGSCSVKESSCAGFQNDESKPWCNSARSIWYNVQSLKKGDDCNNIKTCAACTDRAREEFEHARSQVGDGCDDFNGDFGLDPCFNPWGANCQCSKLFNNPCAGNSAPVVEKN